MEVQETNVVKTQEQPVADVKVPEAVETKVDENVAKLVADVKKKERELTQRERKIADKEAKAQGYDNFKQMLEDDPLKAIESLGVNKDKLFEKIIKSAEPVTVDDRVAELEAKLKSVEEERAKDKELLEQQKVEKVINEFKGKIKDYVESKKDAELKVTYALGQIDAVYDVIAQNFDETGEVMEIAEASKRVEEYFSEKGKQEYDRLKAIFEPKADTSIADAIADEPEVVMPKTLTNKSTTIPTAGGGKLLSNEESKKMLINKYKDKIFT